MTSEPRTEPNPGRSVILSVEGMSCASCAARIERKLKSVPQVRDATVNFASQKAYVSLGPAFNDLTALQVAVEEAGYSAKPYVPQYRSAVMYEKERRALSWRLALGAFLTAPFLFQHLSMVLGAGWEPSLWTQFILAAPVYILVGWPLHRAAIHSLRRGEATMDSLVSLGSSAAFLGSLPALAHLPVYVYFDASSVILFFVVLGRYLEVLAKQRANGAMEALLNLRPKTAHVLKETHLVDMPVEMVGLGDNLTVKPNESIPVDGEVLEGKGSVDEALLTGESTPSEKRPGSRVFAGTLNGNSTLMIKAGSVGKETALARIVRLVEEAQGSKAPIQRTADRVSSFFVPLVLVLSLGTLAGWTVLGGLPWTEAIQRSISVLVIACPCALGLATPIALMAGLGAAAQRSILIRRAEVLENSERIDVLVFDKTGTLTEGKPRLVDILVLEGFQEEKLLRYAAAVEMGTTHPLASAILKEVMVLDLILPKAERVVETPGAGIQGFVEGCQVAVGTKAFIESLEGVAPSDQVRANVEAYRQGGQTVSLMALDKKIAAILVLEDPPRADSREVVARIKALGLKVHLLTGDGEVVAKRLAERVGVDEVKAGVDPKGKLDHIRALQAQGLKVAMAGDGSNDAPALAGADLGIVLGSGTDAAKEAGDMILLQGDLSKIIEALGLSRATFAVIRQNLAWAFGYNLLALPLAVFTAVPPGLAAALMSLSSLTVVLNALRLYKKKF